MSASEKVERLIAGLKGDPSYGFAGRLTFYQLGVYLFQRGKQLARGGWHRLWLKSCGSLLFVGRGVHIEAAAQVRVGRSNIVGDYVEINALSLSGVQTGDLVTIGRAATLVCTGVIRNLGEGIRIGSRSAVGAYSYLGGQGGIEIGDDVIMGPGVRIFSENHIFGGGDQSIRSQGETRGRVVIENDCWIGAGATILAGVRIGTGSVIAAAAVVTRDVQPNSLIMGVPARRRGPRTRRLSSANNDSGARQGP